MNTLLNSWQDLEALLKELDQEMPLNVHFVGPYVGNASRICACSGDDSAARLETKGTAPSASSEHALMTIEEVAARKTVGFPTLSIRQSCK
jgi:hypothetical protein